MESSRIAELLRPYVATELGEAQLRQILIYIDVLAKWNARLNLTAVRGTEEMVTRHFGESLFAAEFLLGSKGASTSVFDVGSGAGFPGVPLKIYAPEISLTLIESQNKKAVFLREVARALELRDVRVVGARAESVSETADLVTMRAVEKFESVLPAASRLVRVGGRLGLLIGERQVKPAVRLLGGKLRISGAVPASTGRVVAEWEKIA